jgi:beta-xylosidase
LKKEWSLSARPGYLRLHGGCYGLESPESPTMLLRKQTAFYQRFQAMLDFEPIREGYEAGIVVWWSMYSFASIGITIASSPAGVKKKAVILRLPTETVGVINVGGLLISFESLSFSVKFEYRNHSMISLHKNLLL